MGAPKIVRDDADKFIEKGISLETRVIVLEGYDGEVEFDSMTNAIKALHLMEVRAKRSNKAMPITLIINTPGGFWSDGMALYNTIESLESHVTMIALGQCCSMGAWLLQAADYRIIAPDCTFMIHDGRSGTAGSANSNYNWAKYEKEIIQKRGHEILLDRLRGADPVASADIMNSKFEAGDPKVYPKKGPNMTHIRNLCRDDVIFTSPEVVSINFADRLLERGDLLGAYANPDMHGLPTGLESLYDEK